MDILVCEDEFDVARSYKIVLESRNHHVVVTNSGEDCLNKYKEGLKGRKSGPRFDVVILDYRMPNMGGMEVARKIFAVNRRQRIIFASAYVKDILGDRADNTKSRCFTTVHGEELFVDWLQKPFRLSLLIEKIECEPILT